ncbi:MAG: amino acid adenylation domain-containing protein [Burkholderiales bacterium]|nr:amino acid adenylation domain-containing protein [Burkholderiales bacterium]
MNWNLAQPVFEQCRLAPGRLALADGSEELTCEALARRAARLAAVLRENGIGRGARVGILGSRSRAAVEAVLGVAWAGAAWVPLGLRWPAERLGAVLAQARPDAVIADERGAGRLSGAASAVARLVVLPGATEAGSAPGVVPARLLRLDALPDCGEVAPCPVGPDDLAYIVFTSGTTGVPKGVMAPARAVAAYLAALGARKAMTPEDRASQFTELTFDPSVGEIFLPWYAGASLHIVPAPSEVSPARFIAGRRLTVWGSTPAAIAWMRDTRSLRPGIFPALRYSSFGGEPLPLASVKAWQAAAPSSVIDNLYGPTEATVDCAGQRVEPGATPVVTPGRGVLAIGTPHPGTELAIVAPDFKPLPDGERGELAIAGEQLTEGYLGAPELTRERFPVVAGRRWYLTGDVAVRDAAGLYHHLGRMDNQVKVQGHRVELEDVEANARIAAGTDQVAAIAWPVADGVAHGIVCFVAGSTLSAERIREALRSRLPAYMMPAAVHLLPALPLNANGKLDRRGLLARLDSGGR